MRGAPQVFQPTSGPLPITKLLPWKLNKLTFPAGANRCSTRAVDRLALYRW
jgi:hypothetical protein